MTERPKETPVPPFMHWLTWHLARVSVVALILALAIILIVK